MQRPEDREPVKVNMNKEVLEKLEAMEPDNNKFHMLLALQRIRANGLFQGISDEKRQARRKKGKLAKKARKASR